ncbi:YpjP family protein [Peribacillus kribbensis]|uniref:YpjP family protein n=1 Tax=Peribacillus kribbensis TaxID=356658 RepID=UPI000413B9B4|nr:YpjP family protein [Peribacillus kribbensis]
MQLKRWIRKTLVILISVLTFGAITPSEIHWLEEVKANTSQDNDLLGKSQHQETEALVQTREQMLHSLYVQAENISYVKFGDKIKPKIENEFKAIILPKMEEAIEQVSMDLAPEQLKNLSVTENPSGGSGERMFNIKDGKSGQTLIKFHVRREHPPHEGFWFNFHYHSNTDHFARHHDLGKIYWDKNTPPSWGTGTIH